MERLKRTSGDRIMRFRIIWAMAMALSLSGLVFNVYVMESAQYLWLGLGRNTEELGNITVIVPNFKIHDSITYDYSVFIQIYHINYTTEAWIRYTLTMSGQWVEYMGDVARVMDGFGDYHRCVPKVIKSGVHFSLTLEQNDSEPVTVHGSVDGKRVEYVDLNENKSVHNIMNASLSITGIPRLPDLPIPGGKLTYYGYMHAFPNPNEEKKEAIPEIIRKEVLYVGRQGDINLSVGEKWWEVQRYHWVVDKAEIVSGYKCARVNITSTLFNYSDEDGWVKEPFNMLLWFSEVSPYPIRSHIETNLSYGSDYEFGYNIAITDKTATYDGAKRGDLDIPWGTCDAKFHFRNQQKHAILDSWKSSYMPKAGDAKNHGFPFDSSEALEFALTNSETLRNFLEKYDHDGRVLVDDAKFNITRDDDDLRDPNRLAGLYRWNFTFRYTPTTEEYMEYAEKMPDWRCRVCVARDVNKTPLGYVNHTYIEYENNSGENYSGGDMVKAQISDYVATLGSFERVILSVDEIKNEVETRNGHIYFDDDTAFYYVVANLTHNNPLTNLAETISGLTPPTAKITYLLHQGSVFKSGETFTVGVDAETGRLLYYLKGWGTPLPPLLEKMK